MIIPDQHGFSSKMDHLNQNLTFNHINQCDGNPQEFRRLIKSIEQFALLERIPVTKLNLLLSNQVQGRLVILFIDI